jgi:hypothetical protein
VSFSLGGKFKFKDWLSFITYLIIMNLQTARQSVSQMLTAWITMLKLTWNQTKAAQLQDNLSTGDRPDHRYMCTLNGMYSTITSMSATAMPIKRRRKSNTLS